MFPLVEALVIFLCRFNNIIKAKKLCLQRHFTDHFQLVERIFNYQALTEIKSVAGLVSFPFLCKCLIFILWLYCENVLFVLLIIDFT